MASPLAQFEITKIMPLEVAGYDVSFTNSSAFMALTVVLISLFVLGGMRQAALVPGRWQLMVEVFYEFVAKTLTDLAGHDARRYFPFVFSLFMFILFANVLGLMPYSFTVTSHIAVTFAMAFFVFVGVTLIGFIKHGIGFLKFFVPHGAPWYLLPLLILIEVVSYLSRPISLSVRLFANMVAGHTMLKVFGGFVVALGALEGIWGASGIFPVAFMVAITGLELLVACLQAYVFTVLTCIYLNDALHMH
ncbi:F0F1 ATP synthase subunit A [Luteithermobacter gelatinilyticus]|uniref:F0F1 ATP synthase subunit A n=1 Tax=Luteithermobacter gelatinilyticus TaxID=2582913 RepID=UPI0011060A55|nr:F0F1 ATP synthase subunit A [Luteithermobacter gelatinilyticus]